jgi:hypothetical protein
MESDVAQSKLDGQQDRDAQFRSFSSYENCLNDRNHCRAAAPDFDHPKHSRAASARSANLALPVWADCVEKLVGFSLSKRVIALILLGRLYVDHDVSLWRAPTA